MPYIALLPIAAAECALGGKTRAGQGKKLSAVFILQLNAIIGAYICSR